MTMQFVRLLIIDDRLRALWLENRLLRMSLLFWSTTAAIAKSPRTPRWVVVALARFAAWRLRSCLIGLT